MPPLSVGDLVAGYIKKQNLEPGTRLPSERKLAEALGVSHAAVNRAILLHLGRGTVTREGNKLFVADSQSAAAPPTILALITEPKAAQAVSETAKDCGCRLIMHECREVSHMRRVFRELNPSQIHGVLLWRLRCPDLLEPLAQRGIPIVVASGTSPFHHTVRPETTSAAELAVGHLSGLGHRKLAFLSLPAGSADYTQVRRSDVASFRQSCERHGIAGSSQQVHEVVSDALAEVALAWSTIVAETDRVTGVVCHNPRIARHLIRLAKKAGRTIPRDLSIVSLLEDSGAAADEPPLTTIYDQIATVARLGVFLLSDMIRHPSHGDLRRRKEIRLAPTLIARGSTAAAPGWRADGASPPPSAVGTMVVREWPSDHSWSKNLRQRLAQAEALNACPFPVQPGRFVRFTPLDLSRQANRSCSREHSWLGDEPLRHLPSGEVSLHGIPFRLLDERTNGGRSAVVLRSRKAHSSSGKPLPLSVTFGVRRKAKALYFLHAAGWTVRHCPIAEYHFHFDDGTSHRSEVIPFGPGAPTETGCEAQARREESTVQDWHPGYPRLDSRHALPCVITEEGDPLRYERYLYVWQWINPHPDRRIRSIRATILEPENRVTLAVLAVTLQAE